MSKGQEHVDQGRAWVRTDIYFADRLFPESEDRTDLHYGALAPDLYYWSELQKWPTAFSDTHYTYVDLRPYV